MENTILHTENLTIGYQSKKDSKIILKNSNITLEKGKLIALVGANGIGKSTLLKTITGIIPPVKGSVFINKKNIKTYSAKALAQELSIVLTDSLPPSNLTVYEVIALGRQPYTNWLGQLTDEDKAKVNEAILLTEIDDWQHKRHYEISDGQLQKALIARALAQDTNLIVLDEPTTHLDLLHKVSLIKLLRRLAHETNKTFLYSTHDLDLAIQLCDEIMVLTENSLIKDQPCNLIKKGTFSLLFQDESIYFDAVIGKFIIK